MNAEDCSTECDPLDTTQEGVQIVANNTVDNVNCQSQILGTENPSLWLQSDIDSISPQSGSAAQVIELISKTSDHIVSPLVSGGSPDLKALLPPQNLSVCPISFPKHCISFGYSNECKSRLLHWSKSACSTV
jgi:hypothetical protein